jgi:thiamine-monophosphate kinase
MIEPTPLPRTELSTLGEFGLIDRIAQALPPLTPYTTKGIGDDAAVLSLPEGEVAIVTTDMLLEGVHFDLSYCPLGHLGYKAVAVNVSDIAAMNAIPRQITVSLGLSSRFSLEAVDALYEGIRAACAAYAIDLVGGDTSASRQGLVISITAVGSARPEQICYRNGAGIGEVICVTGDLGAAYLGLQLLEREKQVYLANPAMQPELTGHAYVVGRQLRPDARMDIIHELATRGVKPTAMIDISDGLASELLHLARESKIGVAVYETALPLDDATALAASELGLSPITAIMNGGEDYELLFTLTQADYDRIRMESLEITAIGITRAPEDGCVLGLKAGQFMELKAQGWQAFRPDTAS